MSSPFFFPSPTNHEVAGYSILLGALSSGNLPQQSIQSILQSLPDTLPFGVYHDPASVESFVTSITEQSQDDVMSDQSTQPSSIAFALELYVNHTIKTIIVVQRARIIANRNYTFIKAFGAFLQSLQPSFLTLLTSLGPSHRPAENLDLIQFFTIEPEQTDPQNKHIPNSTTEQNFGKFSAQISTELQLPKTQMTPDEYDANLQYLKIRYGENNKKPLHFPIPVKGGGLTRQYAKMARKSDTPLIAFLTFPGPGSVVAVGDQVLKFISLNLKSQHKIDWSPPTLTAPDLEEYC